MATTENDGILAQGRYLTLRRRNNWEFVERPKVVDIAVIIAVTEDGKAVFVEQYREPVSSRTIEWAAGLVGDEEGREAEELLHAANRELEEETGFRARELSIIDHCPSSAGMASEMFTFIRATGLEKFSSGGGVEGENITVHLVPLDEADEWLWARTRENYLIDPKIYAGLYFLQKPGARR